MRIRSGQFMYRVRGPDGQWVQKIDNYGLRWTDKEHEATFWKKLHHLKGALKSGVLRPSSLDPFLEGLPPEALQVVEYEVVLRRTGGKTRLTNLDKLKSQHERDKWPEERCSCGMVIYKATEGDDDQET